MVAPVGTAVVTYILRTEQDVKSLELPEPRLMVSQWSQPLDDMSEEADVYFLTSPPYCLPWDLWAMLVSAFLLPSLHSVTQPRNDTINNLLSNSAHKLKT